MPKNGKLTPKQKRFADEYLIDLNATRAYQAAYPSVKKEAAARANGSKLLAKANVAEYVAERMLKRQQRTEVTQDRVIQELAAIAFARATDYIEIDRNGRVVLSPTDNLSDTRKRRSQRLKKRNRALKSNWPIKSGPWKTWGSTWGYWMETVTGRAQRTG
ncbi:MAG: terminase small subunit [Clostridia bacterium]